MKLSIHLCPFRVHCLHCPFSCQMCPSLQKVICIYQSRAPHELQQLQAQLSVVAFAFPKLKEPLVFPLAVPKVDDFLEAQSFSLISSVLSLSSRIFSFSTICLPNDKQVPEELLRSRLLVSPRSGSC